MKLYENIMQTIGDTPIIKIHQGIDEFSNGNIFAKLEFCNPGRSIKDRIAFNILNEAEKNGEITKGSIVIESSSGNTGIGISIGSRVKGYRNIIVIDKNCPEEKIKMLKALGATVVMITTDDEGADDLTERRIEFVKAVKNNMDDVFIPNQYGNENAPLAHYRYTAKEIIDFMEHTGVRFKAIFISVGTGGTITGISKRIKEYDSSIKIIGVEPQGSTLFSGEKGPYLQQGPGNYFKPANLKYENIDRGVKVGDAEAFNMCRQFSIEEGVMIGGSSGGVIYKAVEMKNEFDGDVLCILPDGGEKYLNTIYSDQWLKDNGIELDKKNINEVKVLNISKTKDYKNFIEELKDCI